MVMEFDPSRRQAKDVQRAKLRSVALLFIGLVSVAGLTVMVVRITSDREQFRSAVSSLSADGWKFSKEKVIAHADRGSALRVSTSPTFSNNFGWTAFAVTELPVVDTVTLEPTQFRDDAIERMKSIDGLKYVGIRMTGEFPVRSAQAIAKLPDVASVYLACSSLRQPTVEALVSDGNIKFLSLRDCDMTMDALQVAMDHVVTLEINDSMFSIRNLRSNLRIGRGRHLFVRTTAGFREISADAGDR